MAERLVVVLLESALVKLTPTEGADKVLWMKLEPHGGDAPTADGLMAGGT